jgi:hypothetical protein
MVWPYGSPEAVPQFADPSGYGARWVDDAHSAGFSFFGWAPDLKGPRYKASYGLLMSPERDCFVIVGIGTIAGMTLRGTWIYTPATDGTVFYTTDNQSCISIDVMRRWRSQLVRTNTFSELLSSHRDLLRQRGVTVLPFSAGREIDQFKSIREEHFQDMSRKGLIVFTDGLATRWHYTLWGGFKFTAQNYLIGLLRGITHGRIPRCA